MIPAIYLKINPVTETSSTTVLLKDAARIFCGDASLTARLQAIPILKITARKRRRYVMDEMTLIGLIEKEAPKVPILCLGAADFVIAYKPPGPPRILWQHAKALAVCILCFAGAAFAIMTFNNDANVTDVFQEIYRLGMGREPEGAGLLEAGYSLGLAAGILVFFNHFAAFKMNTDPTPLEVEMRLYEDNIIKTLIASGEGKEQKQDGS